jgi:preprotein translocase subunit SecE
VLEGWTWVSNWAKSWGVSLDLLAYSIGILAFIPLAWLCYRLVNLPRFADFLIAVEAEMNKVSWPGRTELLRAAGVVLFTIFALAAVLYAFDLLWFTVFDWIGIQGGAGRAGAG